jgi:hypothetical protein
MPVPSPVSIVLHSLDVQVDVVREFQVGLIHGFAAAARIRSETRS